MQTQTAPINNTAAKKERIDPYQVVTDTILKHLEEGVVPWRCPWNREVGRPKPTYPPLTHVWRCPWNREVGRPRNYQTGRTYRGINQMLLGCRSFASPLWLTFNQVKSLGGSIRKGERGTMVVKYGNFQPKEKPEAQPVEGDKKKTAYFLKEYVVFNSLQTEGIKLPTVEKQPLLAKPRRIKIAEEIVAMMPQPPVIMEGQRDMAAYKPSSDTVFMPPIGSFKGAEDYHLTLFHELIHATGHTSCLNRKTLVETDGFGGKVYSQEELVAEMGAAFLGLEADIVQDNHLQAASYIQSWLDILREPDHKRWLVVAASQAAKAAEYILCVQPAAEATATA